VRLGFDKETHNKVAIKEISKLGDQPEKAQKRQRAVEKEVDLLRFLASLEDGMNCAELLDFVETDDAYFLVFEFKEANLHTFIKHHRLGEEEVRKLFKQLVQAVAFLHKHKVAHRDIKIENILVDEDGTLCLCDFGFAMRVMPNVESKEWCGSPHTVAPEILRRQPYSPEAVDVWAIGSVLYTLLCGAFPFGAASPTDVHERIKQGRFHSFPQHISRSARDLVSRCLTVDRKQRISVRHILQHPFFWTDDEDDDAAVDVGDDSDTDGGECSGEEEWKQFSHQESGEGSSESDLGE